MLGCVAFVHPLFNWNWYLELFGSWRLTDFPADSSLALALTIVLYDFAFYWAHRISHRVNLLWAAHVVHHQSEDFNLSVGFRLALHPIFYFFFYLPLALLGVPPRVFVAAGLLHALWQFLTHAHISRSMGVVERIFVTPATHSIHHATNDAYLDKNYGGMFSLWDQLFGTYAAFDPGVRAHYGTVRGMRSWNPVSAIFGPWLELIKLSFQVRSPAELLRVWFGKPSDLHEMLGRLDQRRPPARRSGLNLYVVAQIMPLGLVVLCLMLDERVMSLGARALSLGFIALTLGCVCSLLDHTRWARLLEASRLVGLALLPALLLVVPGFSPRVSYFMQTPAGVWLATAACIAFAGSSLAWFLRVPLAVDKMLGRTVQRST